MRGAQPHATPSRKRRKGSSPPRRDNCLAKSSDFPRRSAQKGMSEQWEEPVAGSSSTPARGAKKRETKSASLPGAVTLMPRQSNSASRPIAAPNESTSHSSYKTARQSRDLSAPLGF